MLTVNAFDHLVLNVRDVEVAAGWYERVLGMKRHVSAHSSGDVPRTRMIFGRNMINLRPVGASPESWFTAVTPSAGSADLCFLTDSNPDEVVAHLERCGVAIVTGPVSKSGAQGPICSIYVRDPDGSLIEISSYRSVERALV